MLRLLPREFYSDLEGGPTVREEDQRNGACVLAIDDIDALVFKRERVAELLTALVVRHRNLRLLASCHPTAAERFQTPNGWLTHLAKEAASPIGSVSIAPLDDESARALVRHREPRLSFTAAERIIIAAGGHPAALVFLSRLTQVRELSENESAVTRRSPSVPTADEQLLHVENALDDLTTWAAEFAGAVYAESWAALGPQQRAILWELARSGSPTSASDVATRIDLAPSHVSAQLTRLVADGLVRRTETRGQFSVAPLLAKWIARRAARDEIAAPAEDILTSEQQPRRAPREKAPRRSQRRQQHGDLRRDLITSKKHPSMRLRTQESPGARKNGPPIR